MNPDTSFGSTQEPLVDAHLQQLQDQHRNELENIVLVLASITHISPEQVKPYIDTLLRQLIDKQERPFHETATTEEWVTAFRTWAQSHRHDGKCGNYRSGFYRNCSQEARPRPTGSRRDIWRRS